uniref:Uncharacterized protein n=1 Tax=Anguilla anguilla TaxID=7936 RepID=A0A0E9SQP9_ANGAN
MCVEIKNKNGKCFKNTFEKDSVVQTFVMEAGLEKGMTLVICTLADLSK